jgi:hypothetical protein
MIPGLAKRRALFPAGRGLGVGRKKEEKSKREKEKVKEKRPTQRSGWAWKITSTFVLLIS